MFQKKVEEQLAHHRYQTSFDMDKAHLGLFMQMSFLVNNKDFPASWARHAASIITDLFNAAVARGVDLDKAVMLNIVEIQEQALLSEQPGMDEEDES